MHARIFLSSRGVAILAGGLERSRGCGCLSEKGEIELRLLTVMASAGPHRDEVRQGGLDAGTDVCRGHERDGLPAEKGQGPVNSAAAESVSPSTSSRLPMDPRIDANAQDAVQAPSADNAPITELPDANAQDAVQAPSDDNAPITEPPDANVTTPAQQPTQDADPVDARQPSLQQSPQSPHKALAFPDKKSRIPAWLQALRPWTLEIIACLCAITAFASIIIVLLHYDNDLQTSWSYTQLTLNGLVALLASVARVFLLVAVAASIGQGKWNWFVNLSKGVMTPRERQLGDLEVFDAASRGAWGSLKLIWRLRAWHLCSVGALLTILLLGFDTFAQQVVTIRFRQGVDLVQQTLPSIPRSQFYGYEHFLSQETDFTTVAHSSMKSAIYNGIMNQNFTQLPVTCSTGNCTWPITPTVAVCGGCVDLTPNLTKHCNSDYCNYTLPNGRLLDGQVIDIPLSDIAQRTSFFQLGTPFPPVPSSRNWSTVIPDVPSYISLFESLGAPYLAQDLSQVTAAECALWLCLQAWNVTLNNGLSRRKRVKTWYEASASSALDYNFTNIPYRDFNIQPGNAYGSAKASLEAIGNSVAIYTFGNVTGSKPVAVPGIDWGWSYDFSDDTIQAFWQGSSNYDDFIDNLAVSISDTIRLTAPAVESSGNSSSYAGTAFSTHAYVRVRWPWLAYPAAILVASIAFLIVTIIKTRRGKLNVWKGSATAMLFCQVDNEAIQLLAETHARNEGELVDAVGHHEVTVAEERGFWRFS